MSVVKLYPKLRSRLYVFIRNFLLPAEKIEKYIPHKGKIIDVGCGFGYNTIYFALKDNRRMIVGYDLDKNKIEEAKKASKGIKNVSFKVKDLIKDHSLKRCDSVYLLDVVHHLPKNTQEEVFKEIYKKLKKGGILIVKDVDDKPKLKCYFNILHDRIFSPNDKLHFSNKEEVAKVLEDLGFKFLERPRYIKAHIIDPYPQYLLITKK